MTTDTLVKIKFIQSHQHALEDGEYTITVTQTVESSKISGGSTQFTTGAQTFYVAGERFSLNPQDIHGVFPPPGSLGEHSNVLPHIIFNRSTLPWERGVDSHKQDSNIPWLALLLFDEDEKPQSTIVPLKDIKSKSENTKFPDVKLEPGQHNDDKVTVIDVEKGLLEKILPTKEDLKYLAHVRQGADDDNDLVGDELAVVICNRLPQPKGTSTVHLVSLEGRYKASGFDYQGAGDSDKIRLVSLKSWSFACVNKKHTFQGLLTHLNQNPSTLRLPENKNSDVEKYYQMGYVPLPHYLRQGGKTISWYRSPLSTGKDETEIALPVRGADQLARYNPDNGMFDVSYAAAWELGRLLALQNKGFSTSLYQWKRRHAQHLQIAENELIHAPSHLPVTHSSADSNSISIPSDITAWFKDLSVFKGVPFNYLVPDEKMLPIESIRFFWVDHYWVECLLDGAFSIGRMTSADHKKDEKHFNNRQHSKTGHHQDVATGTVTGFLLRSEVVSGWPGLLVDGYAHKSEKQEKQKLNLLRMDRLSANVLICLFEGEIKEVDLHQKPETVHFGLDKNNDGSFSKTLRARAGKIDETLKINTIPWKNKGKRVVNIHQLAEDIQNEIKFDNFTSAQFALEAIEGVEMVKFSQPNPEFRFEPKQNHGKSGHKAPRFPV